MESIAHTLKAFLLFWLGLYVKDVIFLGYDLPLFVDATFCVVLVWVVFRFFSHYKPSPVPPSDFEVCIVGAGFSGIAMGVKLKEINVKFKIIEKSDTFGGTWWDNQYPGCACDVPSHLYSFSFDLNPDWSRSFSPQPEIREYLQNVADKHSLAPHVEFGKKVTKASWNEDHGKWTVELSNGEALTANVLVSGAGALHVPVVPDFKGKASFKGEAFHTAEWKSDFDPTGRTVAVIGTGASAVQVVPNIASKVKQLHVFQRTPCWVPPRDLYFYPVWMKTLFKMFPFAMFLLRCFYFFLLESKFALVFRVGGTRQKRARDVLTAHHQSVVHDQRVAEKLIPNFEVGCKRITPSDSYLQSFNRSNVTLVTEGIDCITERGIKTKEGAEHPVDTIIFATGFSPAESVKAFETFGLKSIKQNTEKNTHCNGTTNTTVKSLAEEWGNTPNAYKGITCPGYPNFFLLLGPGTGLGHNSVVYMIECQVTYVVDAVRKMIEGGIKRVDVKQTANHEYQDWAQKCMKNKVFALPSCASWYKNDRGINYVLWPSHLTDYWWTTRKFDMEKYHCKFW